LLKLEATAKKLGGTDPAKCASGPTCWVVHREGEPVPPIPKDALHCPHCGEVHLLVIREVIVDSREEMDAVYARNKGPRV
jgi:hypothetical protein